MTTTIPDLSGFIAQAEARFDLHRDALRAERDRIDALLSTGGAGHGRAPRTESGPSGGADAGAEAYGVRRQPASPILDTDRLLADLERQTRAGLRVDITKAKLEQRLPVILSFIAAGQSDLAGALATNQAHDARYLQWVESEIR